MFGSTVLPLTQPTFRLSLPCSQGAVCYSQRQAVMYHMETHAARRLAVCAGSAVWAKPQKSAKERSFSRRANGKRETIDQHRWHFPCGGWPRRWASLSLRSSFTATVKPATKLEMNGTIPPCRMSRLLYVLSAKRLTLCRGCAEVFPFAADGQPAFRACSRYRQGPGTAGRGVAHGHAAGRPLHPGQSAVNNRSVRKQSESTVRPCIFFRM